MHRRLPGPTGAPAAPCERPSLLCQPGQDAFLWPPFTIPLPCYLQYHQPRLNSASAQAQDRYLTPPASLVHINPAIKFLLPLSLLSRLHIIPTKTHTPSAYLRNCSPNISGYTVIGIKRTSSAVIH